jgi:hypothetical protein
MSKNFEPDSLTEEAARIIREEHEQLKDLLHEIRGTLGMEPLLPQLETLRTLLASHFEHEEAPSGLGSAAKEPRLAGQMEQIFEEHALFLRMVDELIQQARRCLETEKDVTRGVNELVRQLHEHEGKENALMLDLADTDLGGRG